MSPSVRPNDIPDLIASAAFDLEGLALQFNGDEATDLTNAIVNRILPQPVMPQSVGHRDVNIGSDISIRCQQIVVDLSALGSAPVLGLVTNDPDWLFPDSPLVWEHLGRCVEQRAYPVFIARKLSIPMFPLLKRVAGVGIQLHHMYLRDSVLETAIGFTTAMQWIRPEAVGSVRSHPALNILAEQLTGRTPSFAQQLAKESIEIGLLMGFANHRASPAAMLEWANRNEVGMPQKWLEEVGQWDRWNSAGILLGP